MAKSRKYHSTTRLPGSRGPGDSGVGLWQAFSHQLFSLGKSALRGNTYRLTRRRRLFTLSILASRTSGTFGPFTLHLPVLI